MGRRVAIIGRARLSSVILSAGSYSRNLFRIITTPRDDYPLKCYFVNDIFTVIGDICDVLYERLIRGTFIVRLAFSVDNKASGNDRVVWHF